MKNSILIVLSVFIFAPQALSQSKDRFIRIVGNSSHTFTADGQIFEITVTEVPGNEYKKVNPVPFDEVHTRFITELRAIGVTEDALVRNFKNAPKVNLASHRSYSLTLHDKNKIHAFEQFNLSGVIIIPGLFTYQPADPKIERQLAIEAIEEARRKAESLSKDVGMRVGKILNIEDTSAGCCGEIKSSREPVTTVTYRLNVTFELKNK